MQIEQIPHYLTWRIRHVAMYPNMPYDAVKLANDSDGIHFGIYLNHDLAGVVSLFTQGNKAQFRKMAVLPELQKKGLGTALLQYLIDFCKLQKITKIWCNARVNAKEFYAKFGFLATDKTYTAAGFNFVVMELDLG